MKRERDSLTFSDEDERRELAALEAREIGQRRLGGWQVRQPGQGFCDWEDPPEVDTPANRVFVRPTNLAAEVRHLDHGTHGHPKLAHERRVTEAWVFQTIADSGALVEGRRVIDVGGAAGCIRRSKERMVWNLFPMVLIEDMARWQEAQRDVRMLGDGTWECRDAETQPRHVLRGCRHRMRDCTCEPMVDARPGRVFLMVHSFYYLSREDWDKCRPGDIIYVIAHQYVGEKGDLGGEYEWVREGQDIVMTPMRGAGSRYVHPDVTPFLNGFRMDLKGFVGSVMREMGSTVVSKFFCVDLSDTYGTCPQVLNLPVWNVGGPRGPRPPPPLAVVHAVGTGVIPTQVQGDSVMWAMAKYLFRVVTKQAATPLDEAVELLADRLIPAVSRSCDDETILKEATLVADGLVRAGQVSQTVAALAIARALPRRRRAQFIIAKAVRADWWDRMWLNLTLGCTPLIWQVFKYGLSAFALWYGGRRMLRWMRGAREPERDAVLTAIAPAMLAMKLARMSITPRDGDRV